MVRQSYGGGAPDDPGKRERPVLGVSVFGYKGPYVTQHTAKIGHCHEVRGTIGGCRASLCTPSHSSPLPTLEKKSPGHSNERKSRSQ